MRLPSIKTLSLVFGDKAKEARELLEKKRKTADYKSVQEWERQCYHRPGYRDRLMCALNEIGRFHGVEYVEFCNGEYADYLNAGDTYACTLIYFRGSIRIQDVGTFLERSKLTCK